MNEMKRHPLSSAFPDMSKRDFEELVHDIATQGLLRPVIVLDGMVLDGWHRYRACLKANREPFFEVFRGDDPVSFAISMNIHRRNLTVSQRAVAIVACATWAGSGDNQHTKGGGEAAAPPRKTVREMAEEAGTSERTIQQVKRAQEAGLGEAIRDGEITAERGAELAKMPEAQRKAALKSPAPASPAKAPRPADDRDARLAELTRLLAERDAEVEVLRERLADTGALLKTTQEDFERMERIMDAEDLLAAYQKEVKANVELARVVQSQNNGLMVENSDLKNRLKSALRKIERMTGKPPIPLDVT